MTSSSLKKKAEISPNGSKTLWEKEKLLVMSNFSFSLSVFKRLVVQTLKNQDLFQKELNESWKMLLSEPLACLVTFFQDEFNKFLSQQSTNVRFFLSHN